MITITAYFKKETDFEEGMPPIVRFSKNDFSLTVYQPSPDKYEIEIYDNKLEVIVRKWTFTKKLMIEMTSRESTVIIEKSMHTMPNTFIELFNEALNYFRLNSFHKTL